MQQDNLTVKRLGLPGQVDTALRPQIEHLITAVDARVKPLRKWRNKQISHRDLLVATNRSPEPLPDMNRQTLDEALGALVQVLHAVESHYCETLGTWFEVAEHMVDAPGLLSLLREGVDRRNARHERIRAGRPLPDDIERSV